MKRQQRYFEAKRVTMIGGGVNVLLGFTKLIGGLLFNSHALVADGLHSFSDLLSDIMVIFASKIGSQDADHSHPYGHQRIETAATLLLALLLILAGIGIVWDSVYQVMYAIVVAPDWLTIPIAVLSIVANEILFHYTELAGRRIDSDLLVANAWHHRADAASSLIVLLGLLGSLAGFSYLDGIAAIIVGLLIIHMGWSYGWNSVQELVDSAIAPQTLTLIKETILNTDGVIKIHQLRSRMMGRDIFIDVHIQVAPFISVSEGHLIAQQVHHELLITVAQLKDVTVHVDPEDDELCSPSLNLPSRAQLEQLFFYPWQKMYPHIHSWVIHYLDGKISIDLACYAIPKNHQQLRAQIDNDLLKQTYSITVRLLIIEKIYEH
ncbi:MAG: cation diffusion facilitator family transporter [Legionella sp.]